ncbi:MAG: type II secretion system secretin GspD [gamma proteobacterium symbiont of Bathyaustriella thionipta]|nr:type II secretion system secretin GspD [gamma proteobacterium symbiont of Bathyaustriella thionipta]
MKDADIRALISTVADMTGKNFVVDPRVKGKVTVISSQPANKKDLYEIFLSILNVHGFAAVPSGDVIKIMPAQGAKQENVQLLGGDAQLVGDSRVTRIVRVNNINAAQLAPILRPLMPQTAHLAAHADSNTLVISDTAGNANRMVAIIKRIDIQNNQAVEIVRLRYANAKDLVQVLDMLTRTQGGVNPMVAPVLLADERTNSILLGGNPARRLEMRALITHLDTPVENEGNTEVMYLNYAKASELLEVLTGVGEQQLAKGAKSGKAKDFDIEADEATNALVITAPPDLMRSLKSVVRKLDIRRAQVHIEAIIAEIRHNDGIEFGIEWKTNLANPGDGFGGSSSNPLPGQVSSGLGSFPAAIGQGLSLGYFVGGDLRALLKAAEGNNDANILSTPNLTTLDNEEAAIHVGQNVPFITGQFTNGSTTPDNPFQTIERHDVGIKLTVTPQINEGNTVRMKIKQEVSSVIPESIGVGLSTNERTIETNVLVDNGQILVLGGLIDETLNEARSSVPFVGDLPLIGELFTSRKTTDVKQNLMIFIQPTIVRDQRTAGVLTQKKYRYIQQVQLGERDGGVQLMPDRNSPVLPELPPVREINLGTSGTSSPAAE